MTDDSGQINTHCPVACSPIPDCTGQETNMNFEILIGGKLKWKQCKWVRANGKEHCTNRCGKGGVAETCPVSCAQCPTILD